MLLSLFIQDGTVKYNAWINIVVHSPQFVYTDEELWFIGAYYICNSYRVHNVRITLNYYEVVDQNAPEYEVVKSLLETVSLSNPDEATISLVTRSEDWNVNFIRHKKKEAFRVDDKHLVSVTNIRECQFGKESLEYVSITPERYNEEHIEVEVKK